MYEAFDLQQQVSQIQQPSPYKSRENTYTDQFSKTMTRNFMHESTVKQEQYGHESKQLHIGAKLVSTRQRRTKLRLNSKILNPLSNPQKTEVPKIEETKMILAMNCLHLEDQYFEQPSSTSKIDCEYSPQPVFNHRHSQQFVEDEEIVYIPEKKQANILFFEQEQSQMSPPVLNKNEQLHLPIQNIIPRHLEQIDMSSNMSAMQDVTVNSHRDYFHIQNKQRLLQEVLSLVKPLHTLKMALARDNSGFNTFWPEFYLKFPIEQQAVISAKRTSARPISTFILSMSQTDYEQTSQNYLGKIKSNALGDVLYVYGPGCNPSNAKQKKLKQRQMVATIRYQSNFFNANRPRQFELYTLKQGIKYFHLKGTKIYGDQAGLDQLFQHQANRDSINVYSNRKPVWNERAGGFMLNFKGRVPCASIKNFILDDPFGHQAMIFGRRQKNEFTLQMTDKISPLVAMAVALSAFDTRIMCQ